MRNNTELIDAIWAVVVPHISYRNRPDMAKQLVETFDEIVGCDCANELLMVKLHLKWDEEKKEWVPR